MCSDMQENSGPADMHIKEGWEGRRLVFDRGTRRFVTEARLEAEEMQD
jgi:hypothetical protein